MYHKTSQEVQTYSSTLIEDGGTRNEGLTQIPDPVVKEVLGERRTD